MTKEKINELDERNIALYNKVVPSFGKCKTVEGEMLRAINRLIYRLVNDGDYFFEGYGTETCGNAMSYLKSCHEVPSDVRRNINDKLNELPFNNSYDDYNDFLYGILEIILINIESKEESEYSPSTVEIFDIESEWVDDEDEWYEEY